MSQAAQKQIQLDRIAQLERQVARLQLQDSVVETTQHKDKSTAASNSAVNAEVASSALEHLVEVASTGIGSQFFETLVEHLAKAFDVRYALVSEFVSGPPARLRTLGFWSDGQLDNAIEYDLIHTPCQVALEQGEYFCSSDVAERFPDDAMLVDIHATSYYGIRFCGRDGKLLGNICILDTKPLKDTSQLRSVLKLFGLRAAQELQRKQAEDLLQTHNEVLEQIVHHRPLTQILHTIAKAIERQMPEAMASVLILNGSHLRHGAAPSLPDEYNRLIDGLEIGSEVGSCGTAAYKKQCVAVDDVLVDPRWAAFRDAAIRFGLRSCWSQPILTEGGNVLGTFALYHTTPRVPSEDELATVKVFASLACVAIERKRTEEALKQRDTELVHVGRLALLGEAVAELTHEINQPLYSITNFARACINETAKSAGFDKQHLTTWLSRIQESCNRASDILRRTTEFVRRDEQDRALCDVQQVVNQAIELISWRVSRDQIVIDCQPPTQTVHCMVNRIQLEQVLVNILVNGCDAMTQAGTLAGRLVVSIDSKPESVEIVVEDNGPGISDEVRESLFDPFVTTKTDGMGMGLAISKSIVENHGGRLWVSEAPTGGTRFHVSLPQP